MSKLLRTFLVLITLASIGLAVYAQVLARDQKPDFTMEGN